MARFDPFGDFDTAGYLQNAEGFKTASAVKRFEHREYQKALPAATAALQTRDPLTYQDVLDTHRRLFGRVYPTWAGKDRLATFPDKAVNKGTISFAHPADIARAVDHALQQGRTSAAMREHAGEIMGFLAHAHPFLEGNGRTILAVHTELARRAGISIDWRSMSHRDYLSALTRELQQPSQGQLDAYMKPFISANPSKIVVPDHQPVLQPPAPGARTLAQPSDVVKRAQIEEDRSGAPEAAPASAGKGRGRDGGSER